MVLDQVGIATIVLVEYSPAEDLELRDEDMVSQTVLDIIVERYAGYEGSVTLLVRRGRARYETLRVSHRGAENRMAGHDARIEDRDSGCRLGRTGCLLQVLNGRECQRQLYSDTGRKIDRANVPMAEQILGQGTATPNSVHGQIGLSDRIEDLSTMIAYPRLEGGAQPCRFVTAGERLQFCVNQEGLITRKPVTPERPACSVAW